MKQGDIKAEHVAGTFRVQYGAEGPTAPTIRRWAKGENAPSEEDARRLDKVLGMNGSLLLAYYPASDAGPTLSDPEKESAGTMSGDDDQRDVAERDPAEPDGSGRRAVILVLAVVLIVAIVVVLATHSWSNGSHTTPRSQSSAESSAASVQNTGSATRTPSNPALASPTSTVTIGSPSCDAPMAIHSPDRTIQETEGTVGAPTFSDPSNSCGAGPKIQPGTVVQVVCRIYAPTIRSSVPDGYWYLIASGAGKGRLAAANTFLNGDAPGAGAITNTDVAVPRCQIAS